MQNKDLFNEKFQNRLKEIFPSASYSGMFSTWLDQISGQAVDVEGLVASLGITVLKKSFKAEYPNRPSTTSFELEDNVFVINTDESETKQRFELAQYLGRKMAQQSNAKKQDSKQVVEQPTSIGKRQPLPSAVIEFLANNFFGQLKTDSLANIIIKLDQTNNSSVNEWWRRDNAEALLANAYLFGYVDESKMVTKDSLKFKMIYNQIDMTIMERQQHMLEDESINHMIPVVFQADDITTDVFHLRNLSFDNRIDPNKLSLDDVNQIINHYDRSEEFEIIRVKRQPSIISFEIKVQV